MSTSSMSLESLHFLLQHMDANRRIEICQRCPSLRELEKSVPLKIDSLVLAECYVIINDTSYELGIIQKCHVGDTPRYVAESNETGGVHCEVDRYGIEDHADALTVTPGDVAMNQNEEPVEVQLEENIGALEEEIQLSERELADERERRPNRNLEHFHEMEKNIEDSRAQLFDYQCRRDNVPSRYELFFQLTKIKTVDKQEQKTVERYAHNKKFSEAMKQMATMLFGERSSPIHVTKLEFTFELGVIRLPFGLKLHIKQLVFNADSSTSVGILAPILDESSFPLKKLEIGVWSEEGATNPIVKTAEALKIGDIGTNFRRAISSIENPEVYIVIPKPPEKEIIESILFYSIGSIESERPVGYEYIFDFERGPRFPEEMEDMLMLKLTNGVVIDDENVTIPLITTQLKISYGPFPEFAPTSKWAIRFLTEQLEIENL